MGQLLSFGVHDTRLLQTTTFENFIIKGRNIDLNQAQYWDGFCCKYSIFMSHYLPNVL